MHEQLTHIDKDGNAHMVNVSAKPTMKRTAIAQGFFCAKENTIDAIISGNLPKGEPFAVARIAGIQAAKQCSTLIPLCHPLPIEHIDITFDRIGVAQIQITSSVTFTGKTGIEMEALTAVSVSALALWDMAKAIDTDILIERISLLEKKKEKVH
jgi:cyclic pyranopterin phosphate synthase